MTPPPAPARLPDDLLARAFRARNGDLAWTRADAARVVDALAVTGLAILGGEVWLAADDGWWDPRIPTPDGAPPAARTWAPEPPDRQASESWDAFCARTRDYTAAVLAAAEVEALTPAPLRPRLRYYLCCTSEAAYRPILEGRPPC